MFENILEYQHQDAKIMMLKKSVENSPNTKERDKLLKLVKEYQNKLLELENSSASTLTEFNKLSAEQDKLVSELEKLNKVDAGTLTLEQLQARAEVLNNLTSNLAGLERSISACAESMNLASKNFNMYKASIMSCKQKYAGYKEKCIEEQKAIMPELEKLKQERNKLESKIDPKLLAKYKQQKQDNIFPVFVPLNNNACGGCSMGIPSALMTKLKQDGFLECEQCHRYIYTD